MSNVYNFTKDELEELYVKQGMSLTEVGSAFNCSRTTAKRKLNLFGIPTRTATEQLRISRPERYYPTEQEIQQMCLDYESGLSMNRVAKKNKCLYTTVQYHLHHNDIQIRPRYISGCTYSCNEHFFDTIDSEEKAYWLGFLATDGYIKDRSNNSNCIQKVVCLGLQQKDKFHIQSFLNAIQADNPINCEKDRPFCVASVTSDIMCNSLIRLGVTPRKSLTLQFPELPSQFIRHYIRGCVDGDGHISVRNPKTHTSSLVGVTCGSRDFIESLQHHILVQANIHKNKVYSRTRDETLSIGYNGSFAVRLIIYLYSNATVYLPRKWCKARAILGHTKGMPVDVIPQVIKRGLLSILKQRIFELDVCERYRAGFSATEIAQVYQTYNIHIYRVLERHNVKRRTRSGHYTLRMQNYVTCPVKQA